MITRTVRRDFRHRGGVRWRLRPNASLVRHRQRLRLFDFSDRTLKVCEVDSGGELISTAAGSGRVGSGDWRLDGRMLVSARRTKSSKLTDGKQIIVENSGKGIPDESPEVVVDAAEEEAVSEIFWGLAEVS